MARQTRIAETFNWHVFGFSSFDLSRNASDLARSASRVRLGDTHFTFARDDFRARAQGDYASVTKVCGNLIGRATRLTRARRERVRVT